MNIAWGTAAILALLLPGFFFLRGLGLAEPFSRDATPRSPIALLAVAVLVSLLAHAAGLTVLRWLGWLQPDMGAILLIASGQLTTHEHLVRVTKAVANYSGAIASYFGLVSLLSLLAAWGLGALAIQSPRLGRMFYEHEWLHGFDGKTRPALVYAVTNVEFGDSLLMYHGQLDRFGIKQDGRFSFIVLKDARRAVLPRHDDKEKISWRQVQPKLASGARLYLDGESITNLLLDPVPLGAIADAPAKVVSAAIEVLRQAKSEPLQETKLPKRPK